MPFHLFHSYSELQIAACLLLAVLAVAAYVGRKQSQTTVRTGNDVDEKATGLNRPPPPSASHPCGFEFLPVELSTTILQQVEWVDVLRVRQTCRRLSSASRATPIWRALVEGHLTDGFKLQGHRLERPISTYRSQELELMYLRWKKAQFALSSPDSSPRIAHIPEPTAATTCLVPGGRWLLVGFNDGEIKYYDLHNVSAPGRTLIPRQVHTHTNLDMDVCIRVDVDMASESLAFNLCLYLERCQDDNNDEHLRFAQIWRVTLAPECVLLAEKTTCFPIVKEALQQSTVQNALSGRLFAYICPTAFGSQPEYRSTGAVVVVDWQSIHPSIYDGVTVDSETTPLHRKRVILPLSRLFDFGESDLRILPQSRLLVYSAYKLALYDISTIPDVFHIDPTSLLDEYHYRATPCIWQCRLESSIRFPLSPVFHDYGQALSRVIVYSYKPGVWAIDIQDTAASQVQTVHLSDHQNSWDHTFGLKVVGKRYAIVCGRIDPAQLISYSAPSEPVAYTKSILQGLNIVRTGMLPAQLDEDNGIIIYSGVNVLYFSI